MSPLDIEQLGRLHVPEQNRRADRDKVRARAGQPIPKSQVSLQPRGQTVQVELETHSNNPGPRVSAFLQSPPRTAIGAPQSPAPHHSPSSASDRADSRRAAPPAARAPAWSRRPSPAAPRSAAQVPIAELAPPLFLLLLLRVGDLGGGT